MKKNDNNIVNFVKKQKEKNIKEKNIKEKNTNDKNTGKVYKTKNKKYNKSEKIIFIIILVITTILITVGILSKLSKGKERYLISNGTVEKSNAVTGYVIKEENVINTDISKTLIPVVAEGQKVKKDGVIATYNNKATTEKSEKLEKLDKEILTAMSNIPPIFSSDIKSIEEGIQKITKEAINETSYTKILEYKKKVSDLINKKAVIVGELSPSGAHIKELIEKRNNLENDITNTKDNIIATSSGIVSYKLDELEDKFTFNNITDLTIDMLKKNSDKTKNTYGIKIVNNFKAYIMFEIEENDIVKSDAKVGQKKYIRLLDEEADDIPVYINKIETVGNKLDITLELDQGIEYFVNRREVSFDFIWWSYDGLKLPNKAITTKDNIKYISVLRNDEVIVVPIKVLKESEKFSIVENYTTTELKEKNIKVNSQVRLYDEIILQ